jgi:hypothetical protein
VRLPNPHGNLRLPNPHGNPHGNASKGLCRQRAYRYITTHKNGSTRSTEIRNSLYLCGHRAGVQNSRHATNSIPFFPLLSNALAVACIKDIWNKGGSDLPRHESLITKSSVSDISHIERLNLRNTAACKIETFTLQKQKTPNASKFKWAQATP